jgi:hypothetical protein
MTLDPDDPENNGVVFEIPLDDDDDREKYDMLTQWRISHQNGGCARPYTEGEGSDLLERLLA